MNLEKLVDGIEVNLSVAALKYVGKRIFLGKRAMAFYKKVGELANLLLLLFMFWLALMLLAKSKLNSSTKLGIAISLMLGLAVLYYYTKKDFKEKIAEKNS